MSAAASALAKILVLGIAYKRNVDDTRESPALKLIQLLKARGAEVSYHDPFVPEILTREHPEFAGMQSVDLAEGVLRGGRGPDHHGS